jgi:hypothetical protein
MPGWTSKLRSAPVGAIGLLAVAAVLYVALLVNAVAPAGSGEEAISQGYAVLELTLCLWIALALLLLVGGVRGRMPGWVAISAIFLHPLAGVAEFVALDAVSRQIYGAIAFVALTPPLIAGYAVWARLPQLHEAYPPRPVSLVVWGATVILSIGAVMSSL